MSEHLGPTAVGSPGFNRQLTSRRGVSEFVDLAVGTHVFLLPGRKSVQAQVVSTGTVNLAFTMDNGGLADLATGTAPAQTFPATVNSQVWATGATAAGAEKLEGPVRAIQITVAGTAVNHITLAEID